jgi:hypothetical protein
MLSANGGLSNDEQKDLVRGHPEVFYPACESLEVTQRDQLDAAVAKYLPTQRLRRLGRHFCDVILVPRFLSGGGPFSGDESNAIARKHPEFLTPFCVAGADSEYGKQPRHDLTRADFHRLMSSVCGKAVRRGYIRPTGDNDSARVKALVRQEKERMLRTGDVHLLTPARAARPRSS